MDRIQTDSSTQFMYKEFLEGLSVHGALVVLAETYHKEINGQIEGTWTLQTIAHSSMLHTQVSDEYIHFALMYTTDHILLVLPIKHLLNQYVEPTTSHKLETGTKPSV